MLDWLSNQIPERSKILFPNSDMKSVLGSIDKMHYYSIASSEYGKYWKRPSENAEKAGKKQKLDKEEMPPPPPRMPTQSSALAIAKTKPSESLIVRNQPKDLVIPEWHAPWKLMRVISGHTGWVRSVDVDPTNEWFATGSADRTVKIWDLATGKLKLTLTGNVHSVRGISISKRHPYMFTVGEDKTVRCWDLEQNKVIRYYHGHLSGVHACDIHPSIDVLVTGGRDSTARVWDIRTKTCVFVLGGHTHTVGTVKCQSAEPQIITGSHDSTVRLWDLASGKTRAVLTNHKKGVRTVGLHPTEYTFWSASQDNIKVWQCPDGRFIRNISGHETIINSSCINQDNVLVTCGDNGTMNFWDWKTGYCFQKTETVVQPGSLDSESGILASTFDITGTRLITCEVDKTIKIWKEDETATRDSHPIDMNLLRRQQAELERY
jgi:pleiotropic regulator 1